MTVATKTVNRLESLLRLYSDGYQSDVIDQTMEKLLQMELADRQAQIQDLRERLDAYERQHKMNSATFYQQFSEGKLGDDIEFFEWSVFYEMLQNQELRYSELQQQT